ncbi:hypothetical protein ACTA71_011278 [Dictyostelium dimigraforme]
MNLEKKNNAAQLNITSDGSQENIIYYYTFINGIASGENSDGSAGITPYISEICFADVFSFSIQMNNPTSGGDIIISFKGQSDDSRCYQQPSDDDSSDETFHSSNGSVAKETSLENVDDKTSTASTLLSNGILLFLILIILF